MNEKDQKRPRMAHLKKHNIVFEVKWLCSFLSTLCRLTLNIDPSPIIKANLHSMPNPKSLSMIILYEMIIPGGLNKSRTDCRGKKLGLFGVAISKRASWDLDLYVGDKGFKDFLPWLFLEFEVQIDIFQSSTTLKRSDSFWPD